MIKLPIWVLTNPKPSVYDSESSTAIEMVAKLYTTCNEIVEDYNKFVEQVTTQIDTFVADSTEEYETFRVSLRQEFQDFIDTIDLKVRSVENYMKNNLTDTANKFLATVINDLQTQITTFEADRAYFKTEFEKQTKSIETQNALLNNALKNIDVKIAEQDAKVNDATAYFYNFTNETVANKVTEMIESGEIAIGLAYDAITEQLQVVAQNADTIAGLSVQYDEANEGIIIKEV